MKYLSLAVIFAFVLLPELTSAAGFVNCNGSTNDPCTACNLVSMGNDILKWLIGVMMVIFAVLLVVAGVGLVTSGGNPAAKTAAKEKLTNAVIGLVIVLAAWLIVDTIIRSLVSGGTGQINGKFWYTIDCQTMAISYNREGANAPDPLQGTVAAPATVAGGLSQSSAEAMLSGKPITLSSSGNCTDNTKTNCTSLEGIKPDTLNGLINLQSAVGVPLVVTGGTEDGHTMKGQYTHSAGYKIDVRPVPALNDYITKNFTQIGPTKYKDPKGNTYYRHDPDHWDITITNS